ncbi:MAG TPA: LemA family protein [Candidatus Paceibacterota bacterium]
MKKPWVIVLAIVVVLVLWLWSAYNGLVTTNQMVDTQWAQVETQYQRRVDLIPNLVASVQGIMAQERTIFDNLAKARASYSGARTTDEKAAAATQVEGSLARLIAVMENYPNLRSSEAVTTLMAQLEGTENRVSVERMRFNEAVQSYNLRVKRFPGALVAAMFGYDERALFEAAEGSENAPAVNLQLAQ